METDDSNQLFLPPLEDIRRINKEEEINLTKEEEQTLARVYSNYWKDWQFSKNGSMKNVRKFVWEQLAEWGHPAWYSREQKIKELSQLLKDIRNRNNLREGRNGRVN